MKRIEFLLELAAKLYEEIQAEYRNMKTKTEEQREFVDAEIDVCGSRIEMAQGDVMSMRDLGLI